MRKSWPGILWLVLCAWTWSLITGCGASDVQTPLTGGGGGYTPPAGNFSGLGFTGKVMAGAQPVAAAAVQMYAAGTAGNGSAPTQLLAAALTSNTDGTFQVAAGSYSCPQASSIFYVVATGGNVTGSASGNSARVFVTVPGRCDSLHTGAAFVLNEVTTAASAYALRPFWSASGQLGATSGNLAGITLGAATLGRLANLTSGTAPGSQFAANGTAPVAKLNAVANLLHGCAGTTGLTGCASLFSSTAAGGATPSDTLQAAISLVNHPGITGLSLSMASAAFTPTLTAAPLDWTLTVAYTGGGLNGPASVSVDSVGNVWVVNYFGVASLFANSGAPLLPNGITGYGLEESYGGAVDATDRMWIANEESDFSVNAGLGSVTVMDDNGPALSGNSVYAAGGLNFPVAMAFDRNGTAWIVDYGDSHISVLNSGGGAQSGSSGYTSNQFVFPVAIAMDSQGAAWVANQSATTVTRVAPDGSNFTSYAVGDGPSAVGVDAANNVWTANYYGNSLGLVSTAGQVQSGAGFTGGGLNHPTGMAVDGSGEVFVANYRAPGISAFAGASAATPGAALTGSAGWGSELGLTEAFGVAVDAAGNVWVTSYGDNRLAEFIGAASPVKTPLLGGVRVP